MKPALLIAALLALCSSAQAQTVYRCGPDGRTFTQVPCTDGRRVETAPGPDEAARAEAQAVAQRAREHGDALAEERAARLAAPAPRAVHIGETAEARRERLRRADAMAARNAEGKKAGRGRQDARHDFTLKSPRPRS